MNLQDVENLSAADLKTRKKELLAAIKADAPAELADRYIQARTDAKVRDEAMAKQGKTIDSLQEGYAALTAQSKETETRLTNELEKARGELTDSQEKAKKFAASAQARIAELGAEAEALKAQLEKAKGRGDRLLKLCRNRQAAIRSIATTANKDLQDLAVEIGDEAVA